MPTSSQALILHKHNAGRLESAFRIRSMLLKEPVSYAVASTYNLSGCIPLSKTTVEDGHAVKLLGKDSAQLFKYHDMPIGYTNILSYDTDRDVFKWEVIGGCDGKRSDTALDIATKDMRYSESSSGDIYSKRPASAIELFMQSKYKQTVDEFMYEKLVGLGFRRSALSVVDDDGNKIDVDTKKPDRATKIVKVPAVSVERSDMSRSSASTSTNPAQNTVTGPGHVQGSNDDQKVGDTKAQLFDDVISDDLDFNYIDEYNRVKPSIYMVKSAPPSRPTAAILSLRENECSFHAEIKFLIETQIGVRVKTIQYDPLHIRSGKPDIRSRWIVDFNTVDDLEKVVKKGLVIGKDKIIIYKYDNIMKREVSTFKYFKAVLEANKKLKGSKSTGSGKPISSPRKSGMTIKGTKSVQ